MNDNKRGVIVGGDTPPTCRRHPQRVLTAVDRPPAHWLFCGACEVEKAIAFVDSIRDPVMQAAFCKVLVGGSGG